MLKNLIRLLISLSLISNVNAETTNNLVSQDFTSGWTNTNNTYHGSGTIAGVHNGTVESDAVSLSNDVGLNQNEIQTGFTVNSSGSVWFWNNYDQSVTMTTKAIDSDGQTITQTRTLSGTCATWNGCSFGTISDTMIFNSNTQTDYNLSLGFSFSVPSYPSGHYAADLKDPSMTITYTPINIDSAIEAELSTLSNDIGNDLKFEETVSIKDEVFNQPVMETESFDSITNQTSSEVQTETLNDQDSTSSMLNETKDESPLNQDTAAQSTNSEPNTESKDQTVNESGNNDNVSSDKKDSVSVSLDKTMAKIDSKIKDIDKNMKLKNLVKIKAMMADNILLNYNVPFYKEKKIYEDQIDIRDNRILYPNSTLISYVQNDSIFQKEKKLFEINEAKQKLKREIEVLKNAG